MADTGDRERDGDTMLTMRIPVRLRDVLERQAVAEHRTLSGQARFLLASAIEAQAKQRGHDASIHH